MKQNRIKICALTVLAALFLSLPVIPVSVPESGAFPIWDERDAPTDVSDGFGVNAECAFLTETDSGAVLLAQNADSRHGMASTTKIMTAILAIELLPPEQTVGITRDMVGVEGSSIYLTEGESLTVRQLLYGLMLESGNDAAVALAIAAAGSVERFVRLMNVKAALLGCANTSFANPHGLSAKGHYTTARELGEITAYALRNGLFREIVSTYSARIPYRGIENGRALVNHNPILRSYDGMFGVKTGWTTADGKCFVTAAERNGMTLVAVTLGDTNLSVTHRAMLDHGFSAYEMVSPEECALSLPQVGGEKPFVGVVPGKLPAFCLPKGGRVETQVEAAPFVYAGTPRGEAVGRIVFLWNGKQIGQTALYCAEDTRVKRISFWKKVFGSHHG